jgi:hypothetical protein
MNLTFWQPANAMGTAATVDTVFENQPVKINFYWSAAELSIEPQTREQLSTQIHEFLENHPLTNLNDRNVFHLQRRGDQFGEASDPGWSPPA